MNNQSAFNKLKPLCVEFLRNSSVENIEKLEKVVEELNNDSVQSLLEYIILPVRACLRTEIPEKLTISCIRFLSCIFRKCSVCDWALFEDMFSFMISKLCDPGEINQVLKGCEELKLAVCENISCVMQRSTEEVLNEMYSFSFRPNLAHAFYLLNMMLNLEKSKSLQITVISTIGTLTYSETFVTKRFKMTEEIASEALASCLPGLSIALQKVACTDIKQGYNVIIKALNVLADLIVLVVGDDSLKKCFANNTSSEVYHYAYKSGKFSNIEDSDIPVILKNEIWFTTVSDKLKILLQNITNLSSHSHWKVRLELLKCIRSLLLRCTKTLENCIPVLLPTVFGLSMDENDEISSYCKELIATFSEKCQKTNDSFSLHSVIEDNIMDLSSEIIRCKIAGSDTKKLMILRSLQGYIEILGSSLDLLLFSMTLIEKIILSLITMLEFDTTTLNVIEEIPGTDTFDVSDQPWPKKIFKFFDDENIINTICKICISMGHIQNSQLLIDYLIDKLSSDKSYALQCIFLIGNLVRGISFALNFTDNYSSIVSEILEVFLSNTLLDPPILDNTSLEAQNIQTSSDIAISNSVYDKNKLQICLLLEAIARSAECLRSDFKIHLIKVLCPVMEKAGSSNFIISQCGRLCLHIIAQCCDYNSVSELIKDNADYITNILLINFNAYFYKPEIAVVLRVAVQQCDSDALVLFRDLIFQILITIDYHQNKAYFLMRILFYVVISIQKWFPTKKDTSVKVPVIKNSQCLKSEILDYVDLKNSVHDIYQDGIENEIESSDQEIVENYSSEESKAEVPLHVNITCEIFKRCMHLQSSENVYFRMLILETVELCIMILRDYENQLHPLVHEFWNPFLKRFLEESFILKAFKVLLTIVNECGDFVRNRTFKDVMPKLVLFLKAEYSRSMKCNFKNYQWTNDHSLQILILSEIGHLCVKLDVDSKDICKVASICLPYLEKNQPKILQDAALKSLRELSILDSDAIWFYWNVFYSKEKIMVPSHNCLAQVCFPHSSSSITENKLDFL